MKPMQVMEAEHRLIETVVNALGGVAHAIEKGQRADAAMLATAVEFFRIYADKLHHGKEETLFFPMLVKRGVPPQGCPIGGLNHEHEKGRALVRALADQAPARLRRMSKVNPGRRKQCSKLCTALWICIKTTSGKRTRWSFQWPTRSLRQPTRRNSSRNLLKWTKLLGLMSSPGW